MSDQDNNNNENDRSSNQENAVHDPTRRRFIKNTGMVAGGVIGGSLLGGFITDEFEIGQENDTDTKTKSDQTSSWDPQNARMFFNRSEDFKVLQHATERIYPKDDNGPGAVELGVPYFIDKQLAGQWGINAKDYRHGPFLKTGEKKGLQSKNAEEFKPDQPDHPGIKMPPDEKSELETQRHQSRLNRGQIIIEGLRKINKESQKQFDTSFDQANEDQQNQVLEKFAKGKVAMRGVAAENFFMLLRQMTIEGAYADPLYGGNKNMEGWKMKGFPGAQPSYRDVIDSEDAVSMEPMSLTNYQGG